MPTKSDENKSDKPWIEAGYPDFESYEAAVMAEHGRKKSLEDAKFLNQFGLVVNGMMIGYLLAK